jgi:phospholipase/lecithinase/hemolysin
LVLALTASSFFSSAQAGKIDAIDAFGDSLSDVGNIYALTGGATPASPYVNGQFSNGNVWVQDLATALGVAPLTPSQKGGTDYAYGSGQSGTTLYNTASPLDLAGSMGQVAQFALANPKGADPNALYTIWIGANDLFAIPANATNLQIATDTAEIVSNVDTAITALASLGAKNFLVVTVPDLGKTPFAIAEGAAAIAGGSALSAYFDTALVSGSAPLSVPSLSAVGAADGVNISVLNTYSLLDTIVSEPATFGFTNVTQPCYTGDYNGFVDGGTICSTSVAAQNQYLFFDTVHPTAAGQQIIANEALDVLTPEPSSITLIAGGLFGVFGLLLLRQRYCGGNR